MLLEVSLEHYVVYETSNIWYTCCISLRIRSVECEVELEVRELLLDCVIVIEVESLLKGACSIEEVNLAVSLFCVEQMHDVASHRSHTRTTTYEDELLVCRKILWKEELTVRT